MKQFLGFTSAAQAASGTTQAEGVRLNGVRASVCFGLYGFLPQPADFGDVADAVNRVSTLRSISLLVSKATPAVLVDIEKAVLNSVDASSYHDFMTLVRLICTKDASKSWSTGKGETKEINDNVVKPSKQKVVDAIKVFATAKQEAKANKRSRQPQAKDSGGDVPAEVLLAPKAQWHANLGNLQLLAQTARRDESKEVPEQVLKALKQLGAWGEAFLK